MKQGEIDSVLQVIENPVRRKIIRRLSQEPCYALQLSKELALGQPLVAKHLSIMEAAGLVTSTMQSSPSGPERKRYSLAKSFSITMDLAPNLFMERIVAFSAPTRNEKVASSAGVLSKRTQRALEDPDDRNKLGLLSRILNDVDERMRGVEDERVELLSVRNRAMKEAAKIAEKLEDSDTKRVLFHILDEHDTEVENISQSLNLREVSVRAILDELEKEFFG